jgi:flagellin FlaB
MEVSGPVVIETDSDAENNVKNITFTLVLAAGGEPMDTSKFTYIASSSEEYYEFGNEHVTKVWYSEGKAIDNKTFLERGDVLDIVVERNNGPDTAALTDVVTPNNPFTIEVKPPVGASLPIKRHAPLSLADDRTYEIY